MNESEMNYANWVLYSDVHPFEIVRRVSEKTIDIRAMSAILDSNWRPDAAVGGFCAHVRNNNDQVWNIKPNPEAPLVRIRLHRDGQWKDKKGNRYRLSNRPTRFHDYNF